MVSRSARFAAPASASAARMASSGAPAGATLSRSGSSKRMKSWKTAATPRPPGVEVELAQVDAVDLDRAGLRVVEPAEQLGERGLAGAVLADDGQRRAGGDRQVEALEHRPAAGRVGEGDIAEADLARRHAGGRPGAADQRAGGGHRLLQAQHRRHGRGGAVERPRPAAEGDRAGGDGGRRERHRAIERQSAARGRGGQRPEDHEIGGDHQQQAPGHGPLAQPGRLPLELEELLSPGAEAIDDPARQPEEPQLLGRVRLDRQAVGVFGMALGPADFLGVPVAPHAALAQQPVRGQPGAGQHDRRPPRIAGEHHARRPGRRSSRPAPRR